MRYVCDYLDSLSNVDVIATGHSGHDAIVLAHEWVPDLVLMDVRIPEMTGLEAAAQLTKEMPGVVVILMSAIEEESVRTATEECGAFAFVMKEHLRQELARLLEFAASEKGWNGPTQNCAGAGATMEKIITCTKCRKTFTVSGAYSSAGEVQQGVPCPFCGESNDVKWPKDARFTTIPKKQG